MSKRYKVANLSASASRPSARSRKNKNIKGKLTLILLALALAAVCLYALVQYIRTDHSSGAVEIVVGSQLKAYISREEVLSPVTVTDALDMVAVRPTSMQKVVFIGPEFNEERMAEELDELYLIAGEKNEIYLIDKENERQRFLQRIYLPIDDA